MEGSWTCLTVQNGPGMVSNTIRNILIKAACRLQLDRCDEMRFSDHNVTGVIKTEWKTHLVGTRAGVLFKTHFDCEGGSDCKVNFLFSQADLKNGADVLRGLEEESGDWNRHEGYLPVPELHDFSEDLKGPSRHLH